jgi:hypothetical protein
MLLRRFRIVIPLVIVATTLAVVTAASALVTPTRVLGERRVVETSPFANDTWIAWTANSVDRPGRFNAFAEMLGGTSRTRLNEAGTEGFAGSFDPGTNTVVFQEVDGRNSNLFLYDLDTDERSRVPGVNTRWWEWSPRISSGFVQFNRDMVENGTFITSMYLYDRVNETIRRIGRWRDASTFVPAGGVGEEFATYTVCTRSGCRAFVYEIATRTTTRILRSDDRPIYAAAVDEGNDVVYFMRSGARCGQNVAVWRLPLTDLDGSPTKIANLSDGFDNSLGVASLAPNASVMGAQDYYYDRYVCRNGETDLFVLRDVTSVPDPTLREPAGGADGSGSRPLVRTGADEQQG